MTEEKTAEIVENTEKNGSACLKSRGDLARELFKEGYNCSQAVTLAFADELEARGISREMAAGLALVCGALEGYTDPKAAAEKQDHYKRIQKLVKAFKDENGSYICRELLAGINTDTNPMPEARTESYYKKRPCAELAACAADILERHLEELQK